MEETQEDGGNSPSSSAHSTLSYGTGLQPKSHRRLSVHLPQRPQVAHHNGHSPTNHGSSHHSFSTIIAPAPPIRAVWTRGSPAIVLAPVFHASVTSQYVHPATSEPTGTANLSTAIRRHQGNAYFIVTIASRYPVQYS